MFQSLIHSRKFILAICDALVGTLSIVLAWFLAPDKVSQILVLFGLWQPVMIALITGIAIEDAALTKATSAENVATTNSGVTPEQPTKPV